jgi:hypothetical protein
MRARTSRRELYGGSPNELSTIRCKLFFLLTPIVFVAIASVSAQTVVCDTAKPVGEIMQNPFVGTGLDFSDLGAFALLSTTGEMDAAGRFPTIDPSARVVPYNRTLFKPDPVYVQPYNPEAQLYIYGGKYAVPTARPLIEAGRELYQYGPLQPGINLVGQKNLLFPQVFVFGDWRTAVAYNHPVANELKNSNVLATKLNLDLDIRFTATERIHAFFTPLDRNGSFTEVEFGGDKQKGQLILNGEPTTLFFEGDLAKIVAGLTNQDNKFDAPFTFGLIPLLTQNGIWLNDAFEGFAFTIPARNSPNLQISNMDISFFSGFNKVTTGAIPNDHSAFVFGVFGFVEANYGYWEFGYGYTLGRKDFDDLSYNNLSIAFTRRYFDTISNSVRVIFNFGQDPDKGHATTADGELILIENSLISPLPLTLVPYFNLFAGFNKPQSLARAAAAGGVLVNTGLVFETDNLTGFPTLDATGHNTYGGALGLEYLFSLDQQIVFEVGGFNVFGNEDDRTAKGFQVGFGARYQRNLNNAWLLRSDLILGARQFQDNIVGVRVELRRKF